MLADAFARITLFALAGGLLGLLVGLVLAALTDLDNPFWAMAAGMFAGAVLAPTAGRRRGSHDEPGT